jgi:hypothetical protein
MPDRDELESLMAAQEELTVERCALALDKPSAPACPLAKSCMSGLVSKR